MASYGSEEYTNDRKKAKDRINQSVTISGVTFTKSDAETKLTITIGGKSATWDYYDWLAFDENCRYTVQPKKLEEAVMDALKGDGE